MSTAAQTPLHPWHVEHGGRMVDFAGWSMPVQYSSIVDEHLATRSAGGLFDISHMGRLLFEGPEAAKFLDRLLTRPVLTMRPGDVRYGLVCNPAGGVLDDVLCYALDAPTGPYHLLVVNAGNRQKILAWIEQQRRGEDFSLRDLTAETAMIAAQGPGALAAVNPLAGLDLTSLGYYRAAVVKLQLAGAAIEATVSRTGYTGEDGCELIVPSSAALPLWAAILEADKGILKPAGLGARDTLRLEAGMPLYGHELGEEINPFQAGLHFAVKMKNRSFVGSDALVELRELPLPKRIGLKMTGRRVPRQGFRVLDAGGEVGRISSGTFSPTLQQPIAMAFVQPAAAERTQLEIDIRGAGLPATVAPLPFYTRNDGKG